MSETKEQESSFPIGSRVLLHSLQKGTEYNDKVGIVQSNLNDKGRQSVHVQDNDESSSSSEMTKIVLGLKPTNLKYQPRSIESLTNKELKQLLMTKEYTTSQIVGMDKSQLKELLSTILSDEVEIAKALAYIGAPKGEASTTAPSSTTSKASNLRQQVSSQAEQLSSLSPAQLRQQAQMMRAMPPSQLRRMNPVMANMTDAQIQMAILQMEQMAQNPENVQNMVNSMKNMSDEELDQIQQNATRTGAGTGGAGAPAYGGAPTYGNGVGPPVSNNDLQSNLEQMSNMSPEQLRTQAQMMKSMTPDQLRAMNPAMANWSDAQVQQSISQMELMASNPQMVQSMMDQVKGMDPEQLRKIQEMAAGGKMDMSEGLGGMMNGGAGGANATGAGAGAAPGGMPQDPMEMLQNSSPAQIKQMLSMVKDNPSMLKEMLRSANPEMANSVSEDQLLKSLDFFTNLDEKKLGWMLNAFKTFGKIKTKMQGKGLVVLVLSFVVFCYGLLMLVLKYKSGGATVGVEEAMESDIPSVPIVEDEFGSEF